MAVTTTSAAQQRLLDAAVDAFAEMGFGGTSTRDIAERAGRSQAAVYIHYDSKEALLYEISRRGHDDALACLTRAFDGHDEPVERLRAMVYDFSLWHMENARLGRVVQHELQALSADHREAITALRRQFHRVMREAVTDGIDSGAFQVDDIDGTARALLSLCIDLVRWFDPDLGRDQAGVARLNASLAQRMVSAPSGGQPADTSATDVITRTTP